MSNLRTKCNSPPVILGKAATVRIRGCPASRLREEFRVVTLKGPYLM